ncbi:MAG: type II toxin-antitoxin system RelB/DinJ family antitoxin, partial [Acinetobacter sp.]
MVAINYNIRIEQKLRDEAFAVLDSYGLSPSQAIKLFLNQVAKTRSVPLTFDYQKDYNLSTNGEALLRQTIKEFENG